MKPPHLRSGRPFGSKHSFGPSVFRRRRSAASPMREARCRSLPRRDRTAPASRCGRSPRRCAWRTALPSRSARRVPAPAHSVVRGSRSATKPAHQRGKPLSATRRGRAPMRFIGPRLLSPVLAEKGSSAGASHSRRRTWSCRIWARRPTSALPPSSRPNTAWRSRLRRARSRPRCARPVSGCDRQNRSGAHQSAAGNLRSRGVEVRIRAGLQNHRDCGGRKRAA